MLMGDCKCQFIGLFVQLMYCTVSVVIVVFSANKINKQINSGRKKVKVKCAILHWSVGGVLISLPTEVSP